MKRLGSLENINKMALLSKDCVREKAEDSGGRRKDHSYFSQSVMVSHFLRISVTGRNLKAFVG